MSPMLQAVLFDLDGTLVDNMAIHADAWAATAERHGRPTPRERIIREWAGKKNEELVPLMMGRDVPPDELARIAHEKETLYRATAAKVLAELPGTTPFLKRLRAKGLQLAVATAAPEENRKLALDGLELRRLFDTVVGPEGVARGKPAPDMFLAAAKALGVEPRACLVFEDAINGVLAGVAAQMAVAAVTTTVDGPSLTAAGAQWVLSDFRALPDGLERLLF
jgi:beta-phosphoglucomutase family hydrolase